MVPILFVCFIGLAICPTSNLIVSSISPLCKIKCDSDTGPGKKETDNCPIGLCNSCQCCYCYFNCPVNDDKIEINVFEKNIEYKFTEGQFDLSDFSSDCWQPPKK